MMPVDRAAVLQDTLIWIRSLVEAAVARCDNVAEAQHLHTAERIQAQIREMEHDAMAKHTLTDAKVAGRTLRRVELDQSLS
jgi:hypothetical protein